MPHARWMDLGALPPRELHAAYTGVAEAQSDDAPPVLIWARPSHPHLCIGASQSAPAELDLAACADRGIEVLRRPLGGGNVWVDPQQPCLFVVLPRAAAPRGGHAALFDLCLSVLQEVFAEFGLRAERVGGQDLWVRGRKILGSGAATLGRTMVFGTSFLLRFDAEAFARAIRSASAGYREWLVQLLAEGMTDWHREGVEPDPASLAEATQAAFARHTGWRMRPDAPSGAERAAMAAAAEEAQAEAADESPPGRRLVRNGLKVNQRTYLVESGAGADCLRLVVTGGRIARLYHGEPALHAALLPLVGEPLDEARLARRLAEAGLGASAASLAQRLMTVSADTLTIE